MYYKKGDWNAICDICGRQYKASELRKTWDGAYVCRKDWTPRHPQDMVRVRKDNQSVHFVRSPPSSDIYVKDYPYLDLPESTGG